MSECFPPVPLYIVAGIIVAMFTAATSATVFFLPSGAVYWFWNVSNIRRQLHI